MSMRPLRWMARQSIRVHLAVLIGIVAVTAVASTWYVERRTDQDNRRQAVTQARFAARSAATELADFVATMRTTVSQLAANPQISQTFVHPAGCTLSFEGIGGRSASHLDIVSANGTVYCSSRRAVPGSRSRYGAAWVGEATIRPLFVAPVRDHVTGAYAALATAPIPGRKGFVAAFLDLDRVAPALVARYGEGEPVEFLVTSADGRTILARSIDPRRWIGTMLTAANVADATPVQRRDLDGVTRLYAATTLPGSGWRFLAGDDLQAVLAKGRSLERLQFAIIAAGLGLALLVAMVMQRGLARPIRHLRSAVRTALEGEAPSQVPTAGPVEVRELAEDINSMVDAVARELAERKRVETELAVSEREYRSLFDANPTPMWIYDVVTLRFLAVNDAAVQTYGFSRDEFLAATIEAIRPEDEVDRLRSVVLSPESIGHRGFTLAGIWRHRRKDGSLFDVEVTSQDHEFDGRPARIVVALDVTERYEAEQALRRSEARYRELFENATDLIATVDLEQRLTAVNRAFRERLGYREDELLGKPLATVVPADAYESLLAARAAKLDRAEEQTIYTHDLVAKDGSRIPVEVASRIIEEDGRPVGIEAICRDISERRHLEEQLRQSQRLEAVGRLAGGVAHDFNNLLTVIGGYTEALLEEADANTAELTHIANAAKRASVLTQQLLAFSRRQVLQPRAVDLTAVLAGITPMLSRLIGEDIELTTSVHPDTPTVLADPTQLEQVLMNLAINARDAMPGGGKLTIETGSAELDQAYIADHPEAALGLNAVLAVTDTGTGIDDETLSHIFEPFFTTKPAGVGTGLGLSTVYGIVKQTGGSIWVYSELGHGTTFKIHLPAVEASPSSEAAPAQPDTLPVGDETIVLVEDEEAVRELVAGVLRARGYTVLVADGAAHALQLLRDAEPELLLTDLVMPQMSGSELAQRAREYHPNIRVLFMSGYAGEAVVRNGSVNADDAFLAKPFTARELARQIRDTIDAQLAVAGDPS